MYKNIWVLPTVSFLLWEASTRVLLRHSLIPITYFKDEDVLNTNYYNLSKVIHISTDIYRNHQHSLL